MSQMFYVHSHPYLFTDYPSFDYKFTDYPSTDYPSFDYKPIRQRHERR